MTDNIVKLFPLENVKEKEAEENLNSRAIKEWSIRRIAAEIVGDVQTWNLACGVVAGAYAVKSVEVQKDGKLFTVKSPSFSISDVVKQLADELLVENDENLDNRESYFSALGLFALEFMDRKCFVTGESYG